ncbi:MAG: ABC transporter ATP-binding protein [Gemmatimonadetes bacterium]|nr:ABC transporter ATP-binding protein [Gemmatimonadota bacterium]
MIAPPGLRRLLHFSKPSRGAFAGAVVLGSLAGGLDAFGLLLLIPFLRSLFDMGPLLPDGGRNLAERLLDEVTGRWLGSAEGLEGLGAVCLAVFAAIALKNACLWGSSVLAARVRERSARDMRDAVHDRLHRLPLGWLEANRAGDLAARVLADTERAKSAATDLLAAAVRHAATLIAYAAALAALSWVLALAALLLVPASRFILRPLLRGLRGRFGRVFREHGRMSALLQETLGAIRLVKAWGAEAWETARFRRHSESVRQRTVSAESAALLASPLSEVLGSAVALILVQAGANLASGGTGLAPEQFMAFVVIALRAISPFKALVGYRTAAAPALAAARRFFSVLDRAPEPATSSGPATVAAHGAARGTNAADLRVEGLEFGYTRDKPVLRGVSMAVPAGSSAALVGASGGGKSALAGIVCRFWEPDGGRVLVDGRDISVVPASRLRNRVALLTQETHLFNDTISANIAYGAEPDTDRVGAAAAVAGAADFIGRLSAGYATRVGDRGTRLSGGERQRIGLARAAYRRPALLILDEATSALDAESEKRVLDRLAEDPHVGTVVIVAHRLAAVREVDRIWVLSEGRIAESGTCADLLAARGEFWQLFSPQLAAVAV